jgi:hypothetical protein
MAPMARIVSAPGTPITLKLGRFAALDHGYQPIAAARTFQLGNHTIQAITMGMNPSATFVGQKLAAAITRRKGATSGPKTVGKQSATATLSRNTGGRR